MPETHIIQLDVPIHTAPTAAEIETCRRMIRETHEIMAGFSLREVQAFYVEQNLPDPVMTSCPPRGGTSFESVLSKVFG
jgi:hypothetical protein